MEKDQRTRGNREALKHEERAYGTAFRAGTHPDPEDEYIVHHVPDSGKIAQELTQTISILDAAPPSDVTVWELHVHRTPTPSINGRSNGVSPEVSGIKADPTSQVQK